jgi:hypothetical protein
MKKGIYFEVTEGEENLITWDGEIYNLQVGDKITINTEEITIFCKEEDPVVISPKDVNLTTSKTLLEEIRNGYIYSANRE